ncbi:hypothetical protein GQ43DRAFT_27593 [Delitschia confertaspora ATCC 74209]|uniref:Secreted protein n=1 Tax=Delitschia confertaspora ATCC 74209 TaxID=1513339 RepID=A0A9P4MT48_9PLEO|nr:hypothetical protein GQ43DRAFT_27593 [Delitschia confertaspora ATCC 74209]
MSWVGCWCLLVLLVLLVLLDSLLWLPINNPRYNSAKPADVCWSELIGPSVRPFTFGRALPVRDSVVKSLLIWNLRVASNVIHQGTHMCAKCNLFSFHSHYTNVPTSMAGTHTTAIFYPI